MKLQERCVNLGTCLLEERYIHEFDEAPTVFKATHTGIIPSSVCVTTSRYPYLRSNAVILVDAQAGEIQLNSEAISDVTELEIGYVYEEENKMEWIKCSDRLPKVREKVLTVLVDGENPGMAIMSYSDDCFERDDEYDDCIDYKGCRGCEEYRGTWYREEETHSESDVTHWMPMPEPSKET